MKAWIEPSPGSRSGGMIVVSVPLNSLHSSPSHAIDSTIFFIQLSFDYMKQKHFNWLKPNLREEIHPFHRQQKLIDQRLDSSLIRDMFLIRPNRFHSAERDSMDFIWKTESEWCSKWKWILHRLILRMIDDPHRLFEQELVLLGSCKRHS